MSQASKQVSWCLNKAKKEIEECKKLGKREKHRGLLEVEPDVETAKRHLEKAEHNLKTASYLLNGHFSDSCISMVFYSMYHCFLAIALKFGYESKNQTCTISLIEFLKEEGKITVDGKYIDFFKYAEIEEKQESSIIEMREEFTYGIKVAADEERIEELVEDAKKLVDSTKDIVLK